jgi:Kinetochore CENP-C fungal homologue, Mif2, N-terminal
LPQGRLDENGLEEITGLFSSPTKPSPIKQNLGPSSTDAQNSTFEASEDMSGIDSMCNGDKLVNKRVLLCFIIILPSNFLLVIATDALLQVPDSHRLKRYRHEDLLVAQLCHLLDQLLQEKAALVGRQEEAMVSIYTRHQRMSSQKT